jgi:hypothetical protein
MDFPAAWCDAFVDWCFYKAFGVSNAKALLGGNFDDYTPNSAQLYKNKSAWYKSPKVGDQIFFTNGSRICHTGLVYKVTSSTVYTIEGNTSGASGVVANGGGVCKKSYPLSYNRIAGYGRPKYDTEVSATTQPSATNTNVKNGQKWLNANYPAQIKECLGKLLSEDGEYGAKTRSACVCVWKYIVNKKYGYNLSITNSNFLATSKKAAAKAQIQAGSAGALVYIAETILSAKGHYTGAIDGVFGNGMASAAKAFQKSKGLSADGVIGPDTWYALFN